MLEGFLPRRRSAADVPLLGRSGQHQHRAAALVLPAGGAGSSASTVPSKDNKDAALLPDEFLPSSSSLPPSTSTTPYSGAPPAVDSAAAAGDEPPSAVDTAGVVLNISPTPFARGTFRDAFLSEVVHADGQSRTYYVVKAMRQQQQWVTGGGGCGNKAAMQETVRIHRAAKWFADEFNKDVARRRLRLPRVVVVQPLIHVMTCTFLKDGRPIFSEASLVTCERSVHATMAQATASNSYHCCGRVFYLLMEVPCSRGVASRRHVVVSCKNIRFSHMFVEEPMFIVA
jgi:hypothetical protein